MKKMMVILAAGMITICGCLPTIVPTPNPGGLLNGTYQGKVYDSDTGNSLDGNSTITIENGVISIDGEIIRDVGYLYVDHYDDGRNERTITYITPGSKSLEIQYHLAAFADDGRSETGYCKTFLRQENENTLYYHYEMAGGSVVMSFYGYLERI